MNSEIHFAPESIQFPLMQRKPKRSATIKALDRASSSLDRSALRRGDEEREAYRMGALFLAVLARAYETGAVHAGELQAMSRRVDQWRLSK